MSRKIYEKYSGTKVSDYRVSFTSTSHPSKRITKTQKDADSDLQPYYDFITKNDFIFSQINPCFPELSRNNVTNLVTNTAYSSILCNDLQNHGKIIGKPYIPLYFYMLKKFWFW